MNTTDEYVVDGSYAPREHFGIEEIEAALAEIPISDEEWSEIIEGPYG